MSRAARRKGTVLTTAPCHVLPVCSPSSREPTSWTRSPKSTTSWAPPLRRPSPSSNSKCPVLPGAPRGLVPCQGWQHGGTEGGASAAPQSLGAPGGPRGVLSLKHHTVPPVLPRPGSEVLALSSCAYTALGGLWGNEVPRHRLRLRAGRTWSSHASCPTLTPDR